MVEVNLDVGEERTTEPPIPGRVKAFLATVLLFDALLAIPLIEGWQSGHLYHGWLLFLLPFNLFALGWILEIASRWILGSPLEPEGLHFGRDGDIEWADFRRLGPIKFSLGILFAISFVLAFLPFLVSDDQLAIVWPILLSVGLGLWFSKTVFNLTRSRRYGYSAATDRLHLPGGEQVSGASSTLRIEERRFPQGDRVRCRPVLWVPDSQGGHDVSLPWSFGRGQSERFCHWLAFCRDRPDEGSTRLPPTERTHRLVQCSRCRRRKARDAS